MSQAEDTGGANASGPEYRTVNRTCWDLLSLADDPDLTAADFDTARSTLDPFGWIPWDEVKTVLCLAGGGGFQGPLFASLGLEVTVADLSPGQLARDQEMAAQHDLTVECVEADICDLSPLHGRSFDLVYQSISAVYVPDVRAMYDEVATVLAPGGLYVVEHWLATQAQLAEDPWDGGAYRLVRPAGSEEPVPWYSDDAPLAEAPVVCWHYLHTLDELVGGLCDAGFVIVGAREPEEGDLDAEPGSEEHLNAYLRPFLSLAARRR